MDLSIFDLIKDEIQNHIKNGVQRVQCVHLPQKLDAIGFCGGHVINLETNVEVSVVSQNEEVIMSLKSNGAQWTPLKNVRQSLCVHQKVSIHAGSKGCGHTGHHGHEKNNNGDTYG